MNPKDWFRDQKWGVFVHFCHDAQNNPKEAVNQGVGQTGWNEVVDALDVKRVAAQLAEVGARYLVFTLTHGTKYLCAPNAAYDHIVGVKPGDLCARRDVVADLIKALDEYGISLFLYFTGLGPYIDADAGMKVGLWNSCFTLNEEFMENWSSVGREYSLRYGDKIKGWWVDACYREGRKLYYTDHWLEYYVKALRAGNPETLLAFNNGVESRVMYYTALDDYTCGEENYFEDLPDARFIRGVQWHILAPLGVPPKGGGSHWWQPGCKHSADYMRDYVKKVNARGGVVSIDTALYRDSHFGAEQMTVLKALKYL